jgi:hypothetical protein
MEINSEISQQIGSAMAIKSNLPDASLLSTTVFSSIMFRSLTMALTLAGLLSFKLAN